MNTFANLIQGAISKTGFLLTRKSSLEQIKGNAVRDVELIKRYSSTAFLAQIVQYLSESRAQFRQDIFALAESGFKRGGYFVEFGATDGITGSNSFLLESQFGWSGVVAEPALRFHADLAKNRTCVRDVRAVWAQSGQELSFKEAKIGALSTFRHLEGKDQYRRLRKRGKVYPVQTVSLLDLLDQNRAPREIDYLSVDTEGSELEILQAFDFSKYQFRSITVEHNFGPNRQKIFACLKDAGYHRVHDDISGVDDWYIPLQ